MGHGEELSAGARRAESATRAARHAPLDGPCEGAHAERERRAKRAAAAAWCALVALALALRVACVLAYTEHHPLAERPVIDEASYERWGRAIAAGDWLGSEVFFQEPLYPYFLGAVWAVTGFDRLAVRLVQAGLGALVCLGAGLVAARLFGRLAGLVTAGALAVHAPLVLLPCLLLKPSLFLPLLVALAWTLLVSTREARRAGLAWWGVGVLAGLGALLRGNVLVCLPVLVLWPLARRAWPAAGRSLPNRGASAATRGPANELPGELPGAAGVGRTERREAGPRASRARSRGRRRLVHAALVLLGVACVLGPVALRNRLVGGVLVLTTSGAGTNLYGGNAPENRFGVATELPWVRGIPEHEADDWRREAERRSGRALDPAETSRFWTGALLDSVRERPRVHARILWHKLRLTLGVVEVPDNHDLAWDAHFVPLLMWLPGWGVLGPLALAGACLCAAALVRRRRPAYPTPVRDGRGAAELGALAALYLATIVLTVTSMRARLPLVVLLAPFAGHAVSWLVSVRRAGPGPVGARPGVGEVVVALLALVGGVLVVWAPVLPPGSAARDAAERDHNLAVMLLAEPDGLARAAVIAAELAERYPTTARFQVLLAETEVRRALALPLAQARPLVQAALDRLRPVARSERTSPRERYRARKLAGEIQLLLGNAAAAERHLVAARDFDPDDPELAALLRRAAAARAAAEAAPNEGAPNEDAPNEREPAEDAPEGDAREGDPPAEREPR